MTLKRGLVLAGLVLVLGAGALGLSSCGQPEGMYYASEEPEQIRKPRFVVVMMHGWGRKGKGNWPEDMAVEMENRLDSNEWTCGFYDWSTVARTINPTAAAKRARDVIGPKLAEQILMLGDGIEHIHLIGHSSGVWAVNEAAKILAAKTHADIHLTFFDAYIPLEWKESLLGKIETAEGVNYWADHYYTRDFTLVLTQRDLSFAHNVDISGIDSMLKDHNFPWQWYLATVTGNYPKGAFHKGIEPVRIAGAVEYGFGRSREGGGDTAWRESLELPLGNKAVNLKKKKKLTDLIGLR